MLDLACSTTDSEDERVHKRTLVFICLSAFVVIPAWAATYVLLGAPRAAVPPAIGLVIFAAVLGWLRTTRRVGRTREVVLTAMIVAPASGAVVMGGFEASSAIVSWAVLAPVGALVLLGRRQARAWLVVFVVLVVALALIDPRLQAHAVVLPRWFRFSTSVANVGVVGALLYGVLDSFVGERDRARAQSYALLVNVLPKTIADRMTRAPGLIADRVDDASVLFADIVGFTPLSAELTPEEGVQMLNDLFSRFDALVDACGAEKIRTIGDGYMVAAGVPTPCEDHAEVLVDLALAMLAAIETVPEIHGRRLGIRIGINTGPMVAGVIGTSRFHYDTWGDTVNVAARMESQGEPGRVHITEATRQRVHHAFVCEPRGEIEVKGKGPMTTFFVTRREPEIPRDPSSGR